MYHNFKVWKGHVLFSHKYIVIQVLAEPIIIIMFYCIGRGMEYMPGAASLAATNRGKIKNIRLSTLRESQSVIDPRSAVLDFENEALK